MTPQEAEVKYGKRMLKKMDKHLDGITISVKKDGSVDIPDRDLVRAYQLVKYGKTNVEWD